MYVQFKHQCIHIFLPLPQLSLRLLLVRLRFDLIGYAHNTYFSSTVANHHFLSFFSSFLPLSLAAP